MIENPIEGHTGKQITDTNNASELHRALFDEYKKRYEEQKEGIKQNTRSGLSSFLAMVVDKLSPQKPPEKKETIVYNELKLSLLAKEYLNQQHNRIKKDNPNESCIIVYLPSKSGSNQAKELCIPRSNPTHKTIRLPGFTLTPVPKSNGYNTEYSITDDKGNNWTQLAILFPAENPKVLLMQKHENEKQAIESEIQKLNITLGKIPKTKKTLLARQEMQKKIDEYNKRLPDLKSQIALYKDEEKYTHFSYIPYREGLNTRENQKLGFEYLSDAMKKTYHHQIRDGVSLGNISSNVSGKVPISEALPWQYPFILNIVERMDFEVYFDSTGKKIKPQHEIQPVMDTQIARSLTTFGANTKEAFNWQKSRVGALGVGQVMPSTYYLYWKSKRYGDLFPESDFDIAARDHETSFRLQVSHFDDQIYQFPPIIKSNWKLLMSEKDTAIGILAILAAGYNGSMKRIIDEIFGDMTVTELNSYENCKKRLNPDVILRNMERALQGRIESSSKPRFVIDKKTRKKTQLPITQEQKSEIQKHIAMYKESMTYVIKARYVWEYLKKNYKGQF